MTNKFRMAEMTWPEYDAALQQGRPLLLPVGATEQHGPHLPLSTDQILPTAVAERVAQKIGAIVAPCLPYGYKSQPRSGGGQQFPGTTSLALHTLTLVVRDIVLEFARAGARKLVLFNGHVENSWALIEALDLAYVDLRRDGIENFETMRLDYYDFVERATLDRLFPDGFPGTDLEHASPLETSMMLAVRPDLVALDKAPNDGPGQFPAYDRWPLPDGWVPPSGVLANAQGASAEKGTWLLDDHVSLIAEAIAREFNLQPEAMT